MAHQRTTMERDNMDGKEASLPATSCFPDIRNRWIETQETLKRRLITEDDFTWPLPPEGAATSKVEGRGEGVGVLKYVGGVDISFSKNDPFIACGALVVLDLYTLQVVYDDYSVVRLHTPYVPGFLAFREAPILLELLERMKNCAHPSYPQLLMVDGNGVLHPQGREYIQLPYSDDLEATEQLLNPRLSFNLMEMGFGISFGLACHLGVLANLPTIGIGKNLHHVDGLTQSRVRQLLEAKGSFDDDIITLTGDSGHIWGAAIQSTLGSVKPIFISVGHRVSLATAIKIVKMTCKYRVPEPIRQADIRSRDYLQKHQGVH